MKVAEINKYGGEEAVEINSNAPDPIVKDGQVLVDIFAAAVNPFDWKLRSGNYKDSIPINFPFTIGGDFSGVVIETGEEVYGQGHILSGGSGALAGRAAVNLKNISKKPKNIDHSQAASLPLAGVSAVQALIEHASLQKGQKVLIHGGAGGIGSFAIQIAKDIGAYVSTTVSRDDADYVRDLGANEVINYKNQKFEELIKDFDVVYDTVGGETFKKSFQVLKKGGTIVSMLEKENKELSDQYGVKVISQQTVITTERLASLTTLVEKGAIKINIDKVYSLEETAKALTHLEKGHPRGKIVVKINETQK